MNVVLIFDVKRRQLGSRPKETHELKGLGIEILIGKADTSPRVENNINKKVKGSEVYAKKYFYWQINLIFSRFIVAFLRFNHSYNALYISSVSYMHQCFNKIAL